MTRFFCGVPVPDVHDRGTGEFFSQGRRDSALTHVVSVNKFDTAGGVLL